VVNHFYQLPDIKKWHGFRLCAVDGSKFRLPYDAEITKEFDVQKGVNVNKECPMGLASIYYDVLNEVVIDGSIQSVNTPERECAQQHLKLAAKDDLVLFDRGYPAFWLYSYLQEKEQPFCMRIKTKHELAGRDFLASKKSQAIIEIKPKPHSVKKCLAKGLPIEPVRLRFIRVKLKKEVEVLVTNLLDDKLFPASIFKDLYHKRWGIEESFKRQKKWLDIENFTGKTVLSVKQDFYAKLVTLNMTAMMVFESQKYAEESLLSRKYKYKINFAQALSKMKDTVVQLILNIDLEYNIEKLLIHMSKTVEAIRNGRSYKRDGIGFNRNINHLCYKRCK
jgi:hypothetical protein